MIMHVNYDSEELRLGNKVKGYEEDMEVFMNRAELLEQKTTECIQGYTNCTRDMKQLDSIYKEGVALKADLINSQLFEEYTRYVALKNIDDRMFHPSERRISVRESRMAIKFKEMSLEIEKAMEERKKEEVKELEDKFVSTIETLEAKVVEQKQSIDQANHQCLVIARQIIDCINDQRKIISAD